MDAWSRSQDRTGLQKDGINTRLNIENCTKGKVGIDQLATEITEVARTFGVPERGKKLIAEERQKIATVETELKGSAHPSVFVYDSGDSSAFTAGGKGIGNRRQGPRRAHSVRAVRARQFAGCAAAPRDLGRGRQSVAQSGGRPAR
ncbi:hypothetical protein ACFRCI_43865 [Streptomyces sp. NPDC056638]|uniref:hypothetical protein n=1 Tax=Streptomyces sp. NPDC056638 TaxID=3345887 RepID=UPI0036CB267E